MKNQTVQIQGQIFSEYFFDIFLNMNEVGLEISYGILRI